MNPGDRFVTFPCLFRLIAARAMSTEPRSRQGKASARGIWWDFSSTNSGNHRTLHKPSCKQESSGLNRERCLCREMSRSSTSPALGSAKQPSPAGSSSSSTGGKAEQVVVGVCAMNCKVCCGCVLHVHFLLRDLYRGHTQSVWLE